MVFGGLGAPRSSKSDPEDLIGRFFGDLGEHFGGLGGSWEQVRILMDFESLSGTTRIEGTCPGEGKMSVRGVYYKHPDCQQEASSILQGCKPLSYKALRNYRLQARRL